MNWFTRTFTYSIGKKIIMALTGLFLVVFLIEHVAGNFLLFANDGGTAYNAYSHTMTNSPFVRVVEVFLFLSFLFHAVDGLILWRQNKASRPQGYAVKKASPGTKWASRNMVLAGVVILVFLVIHLATFFVPYRITGNIPNLYNRVEEVFRSPLYSGFYVFCMFFLGQHLWHGFASAFQTIGVRHPKYYPFLRGTGLFISLALSLGFAAQPVYFFIKSIL